MSKHIQPHSHMFAAPARSASRQVTMIKLLHNALDHQAGDARAQRVALDRLGREAALAGIPILDWLATELAQARPAATPMAQLATAVDQTYQCPECGEGFASHHALCGHQKKHRKP